MANEMAMAAEFGPVSGIGPCSKPQEPQESNKLSGAAGPVDRPVVVATNALLAAPFSPANPINASLRTPPSGPRLSGDAVNVGWT